MADQITGGCACGSLRYSIAAAPLAMVDCQCLDCQKESGTGHASHLVFATAATTITGAASHWAMTGDSGAQKMRAFCPACGAPVYMTFPTNPAVLTVRAASLDDPSLYRPQVVTYTSRAQAWDHVDASIPGFARMPPA